MSRYLDCFAVRQTKPLEPQEAGRQHDADPSPPCPRGRCVHAPRSLGRRCKAGTKSREGFVLWRITLELGLLGHSTG